MRTAGLPIGIADVAPEIRMWRRTWGGGRLAPVGWPLFAMLIGLPLWWFLGASAFIVPMLTLPLLLPLVGHRQVHAPNGFGCWLLFLAWVFVTATQVEGGRDWAAFSYRALGYLAVTVVFLYVLNVPRQLVSTRKIVNLMVGFWAVVVAGGLLGVFLPAFSFSTVTEALLPASLVQDPFVYDMVHASTSSAKAFAAYPIYRPKAPLPYTNMWGSVYALTLPFAFAALTMARVRWRRASLIGLIAVSLVPLIFSLSRGAWLSIGVATVYAVFRLAGGGKARALLGALAMLLLLGGLLVFTPLGEIMNVRFGAGYSNEGRLNLYTESLRLAQASPIFGFGAPVDIPGSPSAGTHGQLWTVIVSHGIPGTVLFLGALLWMAWRSGRNLWSAGRRGTTVRLWTHLVIVVALVQLPFYALLPWGLLIVMIAAGVFWREARWRDAAAGQRLRLSPVVVDPARTAVERDAEPTVWPQAPDTAGRPTGTRKTPATSGAIVHSITVRPTSRDVARFSPFIEKRAERTSSRSRLPLRGKSWLWLAAITLVTATLAIVLARPASEPATQRPAPATPESPVGPEAIVMPDLRGLTLTEARSRLEDMNLALARRVEAQGEPGIVVATDPSLGRLVRPDTAVTIYVGADGVAAHEGRAGGVGRAGD